MHGNVWEWCDDQYGDKTYQRPAPAIDPVGPAHGQTQILRGGSWVTFPPYGRSSFRDGGSPSWNRYDHIGFRVVRLIPAASAQIPAKRQ